MRVWQGKYVAVHGTRRGKLDNLGAREAVMGLAQNVGRVAYESCWNLVFHDRPLEVTEIVAAGDRKGGLHKPCEAVSGIQPDDRRVTMSLSSLSVVSNFLRLRRVRL